jgi:hypothetical protein
MMRTSEVTDDNNVSTQTSRIKKKKVADIDINSDQPLNVADMARGKGRRGGNWIRT